MRYIVDGYNLIFKFSDKSQKLEESRKEVLSLIRSFFSNLKQEVIIVFDGSGPDFDFESFQMIQVVFTPKKMSADDYIIEIIESSLHPSQATIVSSDKKLTSQCKYYGANIMNIKAFLRWLKKKSFDNSEDPTSNFQDSKQNIERLNKIFLKKLKDSEVR